MTEDAMVAQSASHSLLIRRFITTDRILGVFAIPLSAVAGYFLSVSNDQKVLFAILLILSVTLAFVFSLLLFTALRVRRMESENGRLANITDELSLSQLSLIDEKSHYEETIKYNSNRFSSLHNRERLFHDSIMKFIECVIAKNPSFSTDDWDTTIKRYDAVMTYICDTATGVISKRNGVAEQSLTSNIKLIVSTSTGDLAYAPHFRSNTSSSIRRARDTELQANPIIIAKNRPNDRIMSGIEDNVLCNDIDEYLVRVKTANEDTIGRYTEPNDTTKSLYQSFIVVPIIASSGSVIISGERDALASSSRGDIVGFLCVDSINKNAFTEHDLEVTTQLSDQALGIIRSLHLAKSIRDSI
jgi:hypothetical protein